LPSGRAPTGGSSPITGNLTKCITMPNLKNLYKTQNSRKRLLRDFLGYEKPSSPLYGKGIYEVIVERFSRDESLEFLRKGFQEEGIDPRRT
jgi:AAA+ ATPase superfamily predicted ATPase